jgi:replicative DNA helicase
MELVCAASKYKELIDSFYQARRNGAPGLKTGYRVLDKAGFAFRPGELTLLAARPAVGKTSLALCFVHRALREINDNDAIVFVSLEMSFDELINRLVALDSGIPLAQIRAGTVADDDLSRIEEAFANVTDQRLYILDSGNVSVSALRAMLIQLRTFVNWRLVIVDYLSLLSPELETDNRAVQVGEISRSLKSLARELRVPILALAQLNRSVEKETDRRPKLHHLRDSGALEQDADNVLFLYRPATFVDPGAPGWKRHYEHYTELICRKARNGVQFRAALRFSGETARFTEYEEEELLELAALERFEA